MATAAAQHVYQRWVFQCECLRCSEVASEAQNICCWCDAADSRHLLLTSGIMRETWRNFGYTPEVRDPGRILFRTKIFPYGSETSWVGRRKNTCERDFSYIDWGDKWDEVDRPSWEFSWCGACGQYYTPGPKSRKKKDHERWDDFFLWGFEKCHRECRRHISDPQGTYVNSASKACERSNTLIF